MSGAAKEGETSRHVSDMQLVAAIPNSVSAVVAKDGTVDGSIVEYGKGAGGGSVLREEAEDLEVKLRRIIENVPVRVNNTSGSSAGSGSGDFHQMENFIILLLGVCFFAVFFFQQVQYRQMRRKEQDRLMRMDADYERRKELAEFNMRREERLKAAEERTSKKRAKRQKKKLKRKEKRSKVGNGDEHRLLHQEDDGSSGSSEDSDDPHA